MTLLWFILSCGGDKIRSAGSEGGADEVPGTLAIVELVPDSGPAEGGTSILIEGQGFTTDSAVTVGGVACVDLALVSQTAMACITPGGEPGATQVRVERPG